MMWFFFNMIAIPILFWRIFLPDIVVRSDSQRSQRHSRMDFVRDKIANSLMG
jgi:hypothetical protein